MEYEGHPLPLLKSRNVLLRSHLPVVQTPAGGGQLQAWKGSHSDAAPGQSAARAAARALIEHFGTGIRVSCCSARVTVPRFSGAARMTYP